MPVICSTVGTVHMEYPKWTCKAPSVSAAASLMQKELRCTGLQCAEAKCLKKWTFSNKNWHSSLHWCFPSSLRSFPLGTWGHTLLLDWVKTPEYGSWLQRILSWQFVLIFYCVFDACKWACTGTSMGQGRTKICNAQWISVGWCLDVLTQLFFWPSSTDQLFKAI